MNRHWWVICVSNYVSSWLNDAMTNNTHNHLKKKNPKVAKNRPNNLISETVTEEIYVFHYIYT